VVFLFIIFPQWFVIKLPFKQKSKRKGAIPIAIVDLNALYSATRERTLRQKLSVFLCVFASLQLCVQNNIFYNELLFPNNKYKMNMNHYIQLTISCDFRN